jgi:hypothetical protein
MSITETSIHNVERIELARSFDSNTGSRTIRITNDKCVAVEITVFGKTSVLDALPKSEDFRNYDPVSPVAERMARMARMIEDADDMVLKAASKPCRWYIWDGTDFVDGEAFRSWRQVLRTLQYCDLDRIKVVAFDPDDPMTDTDVTRTAIAEFNESEWAEPDYPQSRAEHEANKVDDEITSGELP